MKRKRFWFWILLAALLLGCSCASSRRMMRISPFNEQSQAMPDPDRVNAWPLVYKDRDHTSVLWPVVDVDSEGFAVRPLLNVEGDDWSVLFPLSSWNFKEGKGWLLTAFRYPDAAGFFPFWFMLDGLSAVGPFWMSEKSWGAFPLIWYRKDGSQVNFWPLYAHERLEHRREWNALFYLWGGTTTKDGQRFRLLPFYRSAKNAEHESWHLYPFFSRYQGDPEGWKVLMGLAGDMRDGEEHARYALPFYYARSTPKGSTVFIGPYYRRDHERGDRVSRAVWPLVSWSNDPGFDPWFTLLFSYQDNPKERHWHAVLRTVEHSRYKDTGAVRTSVLYGMFLRERAQGYEENRLLPLYWRVRSAERNLTSVLLAGSETEFRGGEVHRTGWYVFPLLWQSTWPQSGTKETGGLLGTVHHKRSDDGSAFRLWPLYSSRDYPSVRERRLGLGLLYSSRERGPREDPERLTRRALLGLASYENQPTNEITKGSLLFGAVSYKRDRERSRFSILRYLYNRERDGEAISRDFFPFVKWDSGPDRGQLSFLGRVLNFKRDAGRRSGHILFIPFGSGD